MQDLLLLICFLALAAIGYYAMKMIDRYMINLRKNH